MKKVQNNFFFAATSRLYVIFEFYFIKSPFRSNIVFFQRHGNIKVDPRSPSSSLQSLPNSQQFSGIFLQK